MCVRNAGQKVKTHWPASINSVMAVSAESSLGENLAVCLD